MGASYSKEEKSYLLKVGDKIRQLRTDIGLSQEKLSFACDLDRTYIGSVERGERNIRNLDYFGKMSLSLSPTDKSDRYDININVEEKSTSSIGLDIGYNTAGGPFGRVSFLERNWFF